LSSPIAARTFLDAMGMNRVSNPFPRTVAIGGAGRVLRG
jgi:hypothetical protein